MNTSNSIAAQAQAALDRGDNFAAYDLTAQGDGAGDAALTYIRVLALARLGDWRSALAQYERHRLDRRGDVDSLALKARLLKDKAFGSGADDRDALLGAARDAYQTAFEATGEDFAAINAASLSFMIGDREVAERLSRKVLERLGAGAVNEYWPAATRAEALVILGHFDEAHAALGRGVTLPGSNVASRSSTFRQLERLLAHTKLGAEAAAALLKPIRPRRVAHFCGSMFNADETFEKPLAAGIAQALREEDVGIVIGALACGADIVIAEQALAQGIELHVVFPFDRDDFVRRSVVLGGEEWLPRYHRCLTAAASTYAASSMRFVDDDEQFAFGSRTAMGMARLRAAQIHAETVQIAVTNDTKVRGTAGTAADVAEWAAAGGRTRLLRAPGITRPHRMEKIGAPNVDRTQRALRVLVFADFQGFSKLPEPVIPRFWQTVMAACGDVLTPYGGSILASNTWGDGLHIVFDQVGQAAAALTELCDFLARLDLQELGAPGASGMRIAAHFGSVYEMIDPVTQRNNFYGTEVSRAARLEPVTPPGKVYITEPMAAAVEMSCADLYVTRYVGRLSLPKNFGSEPIYALERRQFARSRGVPAARESHYKDSPNTGQSSEVFGEGSKR